MTLPAPPSAGVSVSPCSRYESKASILFVPSPIPNRYQPNYQIRAGRTRNWAVVPIVAGAPDNARSGRRRTGKLTQLDGDRLLLSVTDDVDHGALSRAQPADLGGEVGAALDRLVADLHDQVADPQARLLSRRAL